SSGPDRLRGGRESRPDTSVRVPGSGPRPRGPSRCRVRPGPDAGLRRAGFGLRRVSFFPFCPEFLSYHETKERPNAPACQRCGLSVFRKVDDVRRLLRHLWKNYPGKRYGPHIVKRELSPDDGRVKATGRPGHETWWAYETVERHASFELVETVTKNCRFARMWVPAGKQ